MDTPRGKAILAPRFERARLFARVIQVAVGTELGEE